jgi:hypothetical protein
MLPHEATFALVKDWSGHSRGIAIDTSTEIGQTQQDVSAICLVV